jgi:hypothetical protein
MDMPENVVMKHSTMSEGERERPKISFLRQQGKKRKGSQAVEEEIKLYYSQMT